jgi:hypothetical protein
LLLRYGDKIGIVRGVLSLRGVGPDVVWIMTTPSLAILQNNMVNLNAQWVAAGGLSTDAAIEVGVNGECTQ